MTGEGVALGVIVGALVTMALMCWTTPRVEYCLPEPPPEQLELITHY